MNFRKGSELHLAVVVVVQLMLREREGGVREGQVYFLYHAGHAE